MSRSPFARVPPAPTPSHPLIDRLWARYLVEVPYAARFAKLHGARPFQNDHIALRTLAHPGPGVASFARVFERLGWSFGGEYTFPDVHLRAVYLKRAGFPRIFISELEVAGLPADARRVLVDLGVDATPAPGTFDALAAWFGAPRAPPGAALDVVARASSYGAWLLAFGKKVNHFTAAVDDVEVWQRKLMLAGVPMKKEIEGVRGGNLRQTATEAALVDVVLGDGAVRKLPYAYFEVAERKNGFDGFLAPQARALFDMTAAKSKSLSIPSQADAEVVVDIAPPYAAERKHPRKDVVIAASVAWGEGDGRAHVTTSNMSKSGVFLVFDGSSDVPTKGTALRIGLGLTAGVVEVSGVVMWRVGDRGVGVKLVKTPEHDDTKAHEALALFLEAVR